jgi:hypothetical protein
MKEGQDWLTKGAQKTQSVASSQVSEAVRKFGKLPSHIKVSYKESQMLPQQGLSLDFSDKE